MHAFYHDTVESIVAHVNECSPLLRLQHVNGGRYERISARAIIRYFEDTWGYWGAYPEFFIVGEGEEISWALDMEATFATALERKPEGFFMLVGYNDGGLFSVACEPMPFQIGAERLLTYRPDLSSRGSLLSSLIGVIQPRR
jgi:hypothetical protein